MEVPASDAIENFESLQDFAKSNPSATPFSQPGIEESVESSAQEPTQDPAPEPVFEEPPPVSTDIAEPAPAPLMDKVKEFSEQLPVGKPAVAAAYPFSLMITGKLTSTEKEKLKEVLSREQMGFQETDLEPQLNGDKVLIPRISEYAGIVLVQALRGAQAELTLGPSDQVFSTQDTISEARLASAPSPQSTAAEMSNDDPHPAESLPSPPARRYRDYRIPS